MSYLSPCLTWPMPIPIRPHFLLHSGPTIPASFLFFKYRTGPPDLHAFKLAGVSGWYALSPDLYVTIPFHFILLCMNVIPSKCYLCIIFFISICFFLSQNISQIKNTYLLLAVSPTMLTKAHFTHSSIFPAWL